LLAEFGMKAEYDVLKTRTRADHLYSLKFGVADAAHVAFAEASSDFFISCDDRLIRKCRKANIDIPAMNPVEFCVKENLR